MGKKAPMWAPSKKELEKILEVDNVHELFLVGQVCIERMLEKILEKKFNIPIEALDDPMIMWTQKYLILEKSGLDILSANDLNDAAKKIISEIN